MIFFVTWNEWLNSARKHISIIELRIQAPPKISLSKRAFEKYKPRGLFSEFYGIFETA